MLPRNRQPNDRADGKRLLGVATILVGPSGGVSTERDPLPSRILSPRVGPTPRAPWITPPPHVASVTFPLPRFPAGVAVPPLALLATQLAGAVGLAMMVGVAQGVPASAFVHSITDSSRLVAAGWGYTLPAVYAWWALVVAAVWPLAAWYARVKRERPRWWMRYV